MPKIIELNWNVVKKPTETFKRIKEEKPFAEAIITFLVYAFVNFLTFKLVATKSVELKELLSTQIKLLTNPLLSLFSTVIWILIFNAVLFFFMRQRNKSLNFKEILTMDFFTFSPIIMLFPIEALLLNFNLIGLSNLFTWSQLMWSLVLLIIGIKVFISAETKDALIVYIKSALIFLVIILLSVFISAKLIGTGVYLTNK